MKQETLFLPTVVPIKEIRQEIPLVATYRLPKPEGFSHKPGQFLEVSLFGKGEVPISISSPPSYEDILLTIRNTGYVTSAIHTLKEGEIVGIRGPLGNSFPYEEYKGYDVLFVGGGIGLAPLRSLLWEMLYHREDFGRILLLYGARTPADLLYPWQYEEYERKGVEVLLTVDRGDEKWTGNVGVVTTLFDKIKIEPERTVAYVCGPGIMIRFALRDLVEKLGIPANNCIATLERHMKCGVGKCGHCVIAEKYVCIDGPVFRYPEIRMLERYDDPW